MNVRELCVLLDTCTDDELDSPVYVRFGATDVAGPLGSVAFAYVDPAEGGGLAADIHKRPQSDLHPERTRSLVLGPVLVEDEGNV